ncbi:hypothetical protein ACFWMG_04990 [Streptomyces sp. NPDC127074]|uniref:hypothetical protein n=1 Tax=Streptomyces sp. NPDC127074 TaxID=3347130 RepID=UPI0036697582
MPIRTFTITELAAIGVPPDSPDDVEYSDVLLADEHVATLKYTQQRRCVFFAEDDCTEYAVEYEAPLDVGDFEVGGYAPDGHGWFGGTVEAVEVEQREVTVIRWVPPPSRTRRPPDPPCPAAVHAAGPQPLENR